MSMKLEEKSATLSLADRIKFMVGRCVRCNEGIPYEILSASSHTRRVGSEYSESEESTFSIVTSISDLVIDNLDLVILKLKFSEVDQCSLLRLGNELTRYLASEIKRELPNLERRFSDEINRTGLSAQDKKTTLESLTHYYKLRSRSFKDNPMDSFSPGNSGFYGMRFWDKNENPLAGEIARLMNEITLHKFLYELSFPDLFCNHISSNSKLSAYLQELTGIPDFPSGFSYVNIHPLPQGIKIHKRCLDGFPELLDAEKIPFKRFLDFVGINPSFEYLKEYLDRFPILSEKVVTDVNLIIEERITKSKYIVANYV